MHILGKVLLWLVFIGWGVALYFSARALDIRTAWMKRAQKLEESIEVEQAKIDKSRRDLALLRSEAHRVMLGWDRYWPEIATQVDPTNRSLVIELGANLGFEVKKIADAEGKEREVRPLIYAFMVNADGSSNYMGDFALVTSQGGRSSVKPNWRLRGDELETWKPGNWRFRRMIPAEYQARYNHLEMQLVLSDNLLRAHEGELARQTSFIQKAEKLLELRLLEINGNPALAGKPLPPETIKGLLAVLLEEEEQRNTALAQVDRLRRQLKSVGDQIEATRKLNQQLADSLPQAVSNTTAAATLPGR